MTRRYKTGVQVTELKPEGWYKLTVGKDILSSGSELNQLVTALDRLGIPFNAEVEKYVVLNSYNRFGGLVASHDLYAFEVDERVSEHLAWLNNEREGTGETEIITHARVSVFSLPKTEDSKPEEHGIRLAYKNNKPVWKRITLKELLEEVVCGARS